MTAAAFARVKPFVHFSLFVYVHRFCILLFPPILTLNLSAKLIASSMFRHGQVSVPPN
jgi:hypothetical protein